MKTLVAFIDKEFAAQAVTEILKNIPSNFELFPFKAFKATKRLRSERYNTFDVLCHKNTRKSSGWLVCQYVKTNCCKLTSSLMVFDTSKGGTGKFERHAKGHNEASKLRLSLERPLPAMPKAIIARAAAHAVALDLRPISFTENKKGMHMSVSAVFKAGQNTQPTDNIDPKSYLPSRKCVSIALKELAGDCREEYKLLLLDKMYEIGGAITTDGVTLKVQDAQFYDLTLHYIDVTDSNPWEVKPKFEMKVVTLLLKEKPEMGDATSLRGMLGGYLKLIYDKDIDWLTKRFTMETDCASVMARVALSSVSPRVARMDEKWMGCFAHQLNTAMKCCISSLAQNPDLKDISFNLQNVKKIVRIFKQASWNALLPNGFHLIQECETRFSKTFTVVQRFIKSAEKVKEIIDRKDSTPAKEAFAELHSEEGAAGSAPRFTVLQAVFDAFQVLVEAQTRVQAANTPAMHLALPLFQRCIDQLDRISDSGSVWHDDDGGSVLPSRVCRKLCGNLLDWLEAKVRVHGLWLVGSFLHPLMREFQFVNALQKRREYRSRAEVMTRALVDSYQFEAAGENGEAAVGLSSAPLPTQATQLGSTASDAVTVSGRKRVFFLLEFADSHFRPTVAVDEVTRYNAQDISVLGLHRQEFMADEFPAIKFWYQRRAIYPSLYKVARRVFATPVSSCASERIFSALNRVVSRDRASTSPETLEDIIVLRSMLS